MARIMTDPAQRRFLFLQGPHGPFFHRLAKMLRAAGARTWRVGFNAGDAAFWHDRSSYIPYRGSLDGWAGTFEGLIEEHGITDIVLYGDTRPVHAAAVMAARARGLCVHVFEEGYLRPWWVTYERGGTNGHSRLMEIGIDEMRVALERSDPEIAEAPAHWGDMRQHVFYGALYHWFVLFRNRAYSGFRAHRALPLTTEARLYTTRLLLMPFLALDRIVATARIRQGGYPYHLALLQLEHDASFRAHSPFARMSEFLELVIDGFAKGAPRHHHLVFKAHPLENGQAPLKRIIRDLARAHGVEGRVHYLRGGKLARLLDAARTAVTVNSTAAQQVLWRGIPLKAFGRAVYSKPDFTSTQPLPEFFAAPVRPDRRAYRDYRRFLLETSQVSGGFYSSAGRRRLLRQVADMMLAAEDPYDALRAGRVAPRQPLRALP
ncbi:capsular polysaccharide export system protein KpsS [Limimaricola cinnabarinus LL-001]|uniref:Capsular polysaccharide export system protein KpsS n=2 Tax=Limimaricola cinnabarinus TaxID=1125964 RepID=U2YZ46_9RHOB|nr:capsular polysaccharide export system protein KpsS [Limimaricola cinnabarinus LL-001]